MLSINMFFSPKNLVTNGLFKKGTIVSVKIASISDGTLGNANNTTPLYQLGFPRVPIGFSLLSFIGNIAIFI